MIDNLNDALLFLREQFVSNNTKLLEKIKESEVTGTFKCNFLREDYDFKCFLETLEKRFVSNKLRTVFESMLHLYYFKNCNLDISVCDFISK